MLTGVHPTLELTSVTLSREVATNSDIVLRIEVNDYASIDPDRIPHSLRDFQEPSAPVRFVHPGIPDVAERVASCLKQRPPHVDLVDLGLHAVALGAVRHGGVLCQQWWVGYGIKQIKVSRICPVDLGLVGTNEDGAWFWKRVVAKGAPLSDKPIRSGLNLGPIESESIILAECGRAEYAAKEWLSQEKDWADADIRWHQVLPFGQPLPRWDLQYKLTSSSPHWKHMPFPSGEIVETDEDVEQAVTSLADL